MAPWHDGSCWHLLDEELRRRGHALTAPDLPNEDLTATWIALLLGAYLVISALVRLL